MPKKCYDLPQAIFTHGGIFHGDDICACAFMRLVYEAQGVKMPDIIRVPNEKELRRQVEIRGLEEAIWIAIDIGGGPFDHHTEDTKRTRLMVFDDDRKRAQPYASFGLVVREYGEYLFESPREVNIFDSMVCVPIDMQDECGSLQYGISNYLSDAISAFNPTWLEQSWADNPADAIDSAFYDTVDLVTGILQRYVAIVTALVAAEGEVDQAVYKCPADQHWLELPNYVNYNSHLVHTTGDRFDFVLYPSARGGYQLYSVLKKDKSQQLLTASQRAWLSRMPECTFVHPRGFTAVFSTAEAARRVLSVLDAVNHDTIQANFTKADKEIVDMYRQELINEANRVRRETSIGLNGEA